jgi:MFS family permease
VAYALLGVTAAGLMPVLFPLTVSTANSAMLVGLAVAAFSLGGLTSPFWGALADRYRCHRALLVGGLSVTALGIACFALAGSPVLWIVLAAFLSCGIAAANTVANLFVVEAHPEAEWDERIVWPQTFYGGGQVAGLVLAGVMSKVNMQAGLWVACGCVAVGAVIGWLTARTP